MRNCADCSVLRHKDIYLSIAGAIVASSLNIWAYTAAANRKLQGKLLTPTLVLVLDLILISLVAAGVAIARPPAGLRPPSADGLPRISPSTDGYRLRQRPLATMPAKEVFLKNSVEQWLTRKLARRCVSIQLHRSPLRGKAGHGW
jgi:hypothetical protein